MERLFLKPNYVYTSIFLNRTVFKGLEGAVIQSLA